ATDGVEALAILAVEKIDAVISDILMPRMDGYRLCIEIRQSEKFGGVPFIVYTGTYTSPSDEKTALLLGVDRFLRRPSPGIEIIQALRQAITDAPGHQPKANTRGQELDVLREYNQRLLVKLEKKNAELQAQTQELRATDEKLRHLLAHIPAVIYTLKIHNTKVTP